MKNKKGQSNLMGVIVSIVFTVIVIGMIVIIIDMDLHRREQAQSCEDLGMKFYQQARIKFCIDDLDQAHNVMFECKGLLWNKQCKARLISIGVGSAIS